MWILNKHPSQYHQSKENIHGFEWISQKRNSCETKIKIRYRFICCNALFAQYFCKRGAAAQHTRKHNFVRSRHALLGKPQLQLVNLIIGIKCSYSESRSIETCYYCVMAFRYVVVTVPSILFFLSFFWAACRPAIRLLCSGGAFFFYLFGRVR